MYEIRSGIKAEAYVKKNMAESDCGVACHKNINNVGKKMSGCLTAVHNCKICCLELSIKPEPEIVALCPLEGNTACSLTRTATAEVIKGRKAVTPKTNLQFIDVTTITISQKHQYYGNLVPCYSPYTISIH